MKENFVIFSPDGAFCRQIENRPEMFRQISALLKEEHGRPVYFSYEPDELYGPDCGETYKWELAPSGLVQKTLIETNEDF